MPRLGCATSSIGEVAISDHRSSQPTFDELVRLAADAHVAGLMTRKAGLLHLHLGDGPRGLSMLRRALDETPRGDLVPEATFRNAFALYQQGRPDDARAIAEKLGALPVTAATIGAFATLTLLTKNSFLDEIKKQYVMTARAKGLTENRVLYGHVFRIAMLIVIAGFPGLFLAVFFLWPFAQTVVKAFTVDGQTSTGNFARMASDLNFWPAMRNTFALVLVVVPLQVCLALAMAVMIQKMTRGRDIVLWIWTIPLGISDLAAGLAWLAILSNNGYFWSAPLGSLVDYESPGLLIAVVGAAGSGRAAETSIDRSRSAAARLAASAGVSPPWAECGLAVL
jgi:ABC-type proline/glycine betaine transport system permease subunit